MKLLLKRQVKGNVASKAKLVNKARVANMLKVAADSRRPANSKFIHLSAIRAYQRQEAWKLKVRKISKIQFALV